ncbi:MAG TPA: type IV toxin-antitoxin system AbiEi family antitoxin domain-containing protein [Solirubrobacteraceae bacterium]
MAARQHGNVTYEQLVALGFTKTRIAHRVRTGRLFRAHRGVFAVGRPARTPLERAAAAVFACGPGAALSHEGALALWGLTHRWPASWHVTVAADRRPKGITVHRSRALLRRDLRIQLDIRVTSPARTVLDCAPSLPDKPLTRLVNDALRTPYLRRSQLADVCRRFPTHAGARRLRPFVDLDDATTRSSFEDEFLAFCERFGFPRPLVNVRVAGHEVDALFADERVIVELDGWAFHRDRLAFESDRDRDADTLAAGFPTLRITWERFHRAPAAEADRLRTILRRR